MALSLLTKWKTLQRAIAHPGVKPSDGMVLTRFLDHLNNSTRQLNPSYQTIADATGLSRDTVMTSVKNLETIGIIKVNRSVEVGSRAAKGQRLPSNSFTINFDPTCWSEIPTTPSRKNRPPQSKITTTPVANSDYPQSEKPVEGSRKSRPKHRKEETGKDEHSNRTRAAGADVAVNVATIIFDNGRRYLQKNGIEEKQARSMLGRWRRDFGDDRLLNALREAHRQGVSEPIAFITAALRSQTNTQPNVGSRSASLGIEGA